LNTVARISAESELTVLVRDAYDAYNRGDYDHVLDLFDPEVEWQPPPNSLEPQALRGRDAVRAYLLPDLFEQQSAEPEEIMEQGERILVVARVRARGTGSGIEIEDTAFHLWTVRDGRAVRFQAFVDRAQADAALAGG